MGRTSRALPLPDCLAWPSPPLWLPDWKDADAYPADSAPRGLWGWQFLRRNALYSADHATAAALPENERRQYAAPEPGDPDPVLDGYECSPAALPGERLSEYWRRSPHSPLPVFPDPHVSIVTPYQILARRWGVAFDLPDPAAPDDEEAVETLIHQADMRPLMEQIGGLAALCYPGHPQTLTFTLRCDLPLDEQLRRVKRCADDQRRGRALSPVATLNGARYVLFLRILDGAVAGATRADLARELLPDNYRKPSREIDRNFAAAVQMVESDHRALLS